MITCDSATGVYMGPARVLEALPGVARVLIGDSERWAALALASPYQVAAGDTVVVLAQEERCYLIGVLQGTGATVFRFPGDLELQALRGTVRVTAGKGIDLRSPEIGLEGDRVEVRAHTFVEKIVDAYRWIKGLLQIQAGRARTVVEDTNYQKAGQQVLLADRDVKIDGEQIRLG